MQIWFQLACWENDSYAHKMWWMNPQFIMMRNYWPMELIFDYFVRFWRSFCFHCIIIFILCIKIKGINFFFSYWGCIFFGTSWSFYRSLFAHACTFVFSCIYAYYVDKWDVELPMILLTDGFIEYYFMRRFLKF